MTMAPRAAGAGVRKPPREMLCRRRAKPSAPEATMESPMQQPHDLSRSLIPFCQESTLIGVVDMSQSGWLVAGIVPGVESHPLKKLDPDQEALLQLIQRWRDEAVKAGRTIARIALSFEAGRDGFWLARWLRLRGVESYVIHSTSVAVPREHRRGENGRVRPQRFQQGFFALVFVCGGPSV